MKVDAQRYVPQQPPTEISYGLLDWLRREFHAIYRGMAQQPVARLEVLHDAPDNPQTGWLAYADGTDWDPGSGAGVYAYTGAAWVKL